MNAHGAAGDGSWSRLALAAGVVGIPAFTLQPPDSVASELVYLATVAVAVAAAAVASWRMRAGRAAGWWILLVSLVLTLSLNAADAAVTAAWLPLEGSGIVEAAFLLPYAVAAVGLVALLRDRPAGRNRTAGLDAVIIALGIGMASFLLAIDTVDVLGGTRGDIGLDTLVVASTYAVGLPALILGGWLAFTPGHPRPAVGLLVAAIVLQSAGDGMYGIELTAPTLAFPNDAAWLAAVALLAAAVAHPSTASHAPVDTRPLLGQRARLALLGAALLAPTIDTIPAYLAGRPAGPLGFVAVAVAVLATVRILILLGQVDELVRDTGILRRTTSELDRARSAYKLLVERAPAVTWTLPQGSAGQAGADGYFVSPQVEALTGYPATDFMTGRIAWVRDVIHPDDRAEAVQRYEQLLGAAEAGAPDTGDRFSYEYRIVTRDGRARWVRDDEQVLRDADGRVTASHGIAIDITERRRMEERLRASETHFRTLVDQLPGVVWVSEWRATDDEAGETFVSSQILALTGYRPEGFVDGTLRWSQIIHPDDRAAVVDRFGRLLADVRATTGGFGQGYTDEYRIVRADGQVRWVSDTKHLIRDDGRAVEVQGLVLDITEQREALARLAESEQRYKALVEQLPSMTWVARIPAGGGGPVRTYMGPQVRELTGHPAEDFDAGRVHWRDVVHPDDLDSFLERLRSGVAEAVAGEPGTRDSFESEYRIVAADGRVLWVHDEVHALRDTTGAVVAIQGVLDDRTAEHDASAALQRLNAELETRVAERTADLDTAREEAVRASRAKSEFLSSISHELRTPLNAVLGFGQLLQVADLAPPDRESADEIVRAGRSLLAIIDEVLEFNRLDAGRISLSIEPVGIGPLVREAGDLVRPATEERRIVLDVTAGVESTIVVLADRRRLGQILLNLLSNAVKYNRDGGSIVVGSAAGGGRARIEVTDTGVGLDPIRLARVFEPFQAPARGDSGRRSVGLGLALSHRLAALMGGSLSAVSSPGVGSTFTIDLALAAPGALDVLSLDQPAGQPTGSDADRAAPARTLLYIEDNLSNIHLVERMLQNRTGIRILAAMQGRLGLELAREHRPDLILLDVHLPDVEPEETLADLKADERTRGIPVVVLSSEVSSDNASRMLELGAAAYLTKPLDLARFDHVIDEVLGR